MVVWYVEIVIYFLEMEIGKNNETAQKKILRKVQEIQENKSEGGVHLLQD